MYILYIYIYICTIVVLVNDETGFLFVNGHVSKDCSWGVSVLSAVVSEQKRVWQPQSAGRTDVNNCYDEFFTYPSSRDVYRKAVGSTGTTTATTTFPLLVGGSSDGWSVTGPCSISGDCIQSGNFPGKYGDSEQCGINMPQPSVINFTAFSTEKSYDILAVNGVGYSGDGEAGFIVVAWGNITWRADSSVASTGWELCFVSPKCHDGLALSPVGVPDCPPGPEALPSCDEALPGELCEGGCGTRSDINNCCWRVISDCSFSSPLGMMIPTYSPLYIYTIYTHIHTAYIYVYIIIYPYIILISHDIRSIWDDDPNWLGGLLKHDTRLRCTLQLPTLARCLPKGWR